MTRRVPIAIITFLAMLTYVSGLAMHLHLVWEHGPVASQQGEKRGSERVCSHGHSHGHFHGHSHGREHSHWHGHSHDHGPASSSSSPDQRHGTEQDDCPTCIAMAGYVAPQVSLTAAICFDLPLIHRLAMESSPVSFLTSIDRPTSRGPPSLAI